MEEKRGSHFSALVFLMSEIAMADAFVVIFVAGAGSSSMDLAALPWLALTVAVYTLYLIYLRVERTLLQAVIFLVVSYVVSSAVLIVFFERPQSILSTVATLLFWSIPMCRIFFLTQKPPALDKLIWRFGMVIIVVLAVLVFVVGTGAPYIKTLPCAASLLLCFIALIVLRTANSGEEENRGIRGFAVVLAFVLFVGSIVAVFLMFAAYSFGDAIATGAAALLRGIKFFFGLLARLIIWLSSLMPAPRGYDAPLDMNMPPMVADGINESEYLPSPGPTALLIILCVFAALVAAAFIIYIIKFRRVRLGGKWLRKTTIKRKRKTRQRLAFFRRYISAAGFFFDSILYRNTPQGVFLRLERWGWLRRCGPQPGETQRSYITRVCSEAPKHKDSLMRLADALDARWYGDPKLSQMAAHELAALRMVFTV